MQQQSGNVPVRWSSEPTRIFMPVGAEIVNFDSSLGIRYVAPIWSLPDDPAEYFPMDEYIAQMAFKSQPMGGELLRVGAGFGDYWLYKVGTTLVRAAAGGGLETLPLNEAHQPSPA